MLIPTGEWLAPGPPATPDHRNRKANMITARNLLSSFAALRARAEAVADELGTWVRNEDGMYTVEWVLVIIAVLHTLVWPMYLVMQKLTFYYEVTSWTVALPFP
jgi:hypothetical protein